MSGLQQSSEGTNLPTERMMPRIQRFGVKDVEVTFLGNNTNGQPTWLLWNQSEPYLIGLLVQGQLGFDFEQRTSVGVLHHENISLSRLYRELSE